MSDDHSSPIKTPKQLIIVVVLAFAIPIVIIAMVSQLVSGVRKGAQEDDRHVLARIQPVGTVVLAEAGGPKGSLTGEQVYGQVCKTCHEAGIAGAPKMGDKSAWSARIAQGEKVAVQHALAGFQGKTGVMPPKGGNPDLTDEEVQRAVVYIANQAGAGWKEAPVTTTVAATSSAGPAAGRATGTEASAATAAAPGATTALAAATAPTSATAAAAGPAASGKAVFDETCTVCHAAGIVGAPKFGDKAAWAPRIAQGVPTLYQHALGGFTGKSGVMPPRGGNNALADAQVKAAVDYMVAAAK